MKEPGISLDKLMKAVGFEPHSQTQRDYITSKARFNVTCCGRRWGKTLSTGLRMTHKLFIPDTYNWIVGPNYRLGEKEFRVVMNNLIKLDLWKHCRHSYAPKQGDMRITTPWNSVLEVVSAERQESLLGEGLDHAVMSEAAVHSQNTWEQFVEPALSDKLGSCDFPSTPRGYNWYHALWQMGQLPGQDQYRSWTLPTWTNTVRYPGGINDPEIQRIKSQVSKQYFDQEYGAKFTSFAGMIYEEWSESKHVVPHEFDPALPNYLAFDYGFANPFVALDIQVGPSDQVYVWREYYERNRSTYEHGLALKNRDNPEGYHIDGMWGDPRGADEQAILALTLGHVHHDDVPWKLGVEAVKRCLKNDVITQTVTSHDTVRPQLTVDPSCANLIRQMGQLHVKVTRSQDDVVEMGASGTNNIQHKVDDHACDALRYFIGPYFVLGAGSHMADVYDHSYRNSESQSEFMRLSETIRLGAPVGF